MPIPSLQSLAQQSHTLADKRDQLLKQIRELPGFERFLLPKPIFELVAAAKRGPVAMLNISQYGCSALILKPGRGDEVVHVPLSFTLDEARSLAKSLGSLVRGAVRSERWAYIREGEPPPDETFSNILSELWIRIVKPVLDVLGLKVSNPSLKM
jgi:hypothetical protein